jgi:hypothetical protein
MPSKEKLAKMFAPSTKVTKLRADALLPHPQAQRELVPARLKKVRDSLDLDAIGVLHIVQYPIKGQNGYWIVDGQHRWRALMDLGLGEWEVEVKIHLDVKDDARASALFLKLNDRSPVSPFDKFQNSLRAKDDIAIAVNDIVLKHHLKVSASVGDGKVCGVTTLIKTYRFNNGEALDKSLETITGAWGLRAFDSKLVEGVGLLFARFNGMIDQPALIAKMAKYPGGPRAMLGDARNLMNIRKSSTSRAIAEIVLGAYNKGRSTGKLDQL